MTTAVHALDASATPRRRPGRHAKHSQGEETEDNEVEHEDEREESDVVDDCITSGIVIVVLAIMGGLCWFLFTHMTSPSELVSQRLQHAPRVKPKHIHAHVDLVQLYNGHVLQVDVQRQLVCRQCAGTGIDMREGFHECHACHGSGMRTYQQQVGPITQHVRSTCNVCNGRGKVANKKCDVCHGHGLLRDHKLLDVRVARGMRHGDSITIANEGDQTRGMLPGDVVVHLHMEPHAQFNRRGDDLEIVLEISLLEALVGFQRDVHHLDNRILPLVRSDVVAPTTVWKIRGEGMPMTNATGTFGDLLVRFNIQYPTTLTSEDKAMIAELL